jgi:hypothetical protein
MRSLGKPSDEKQEGGVARKPGREKDKNRPRLKRRDQGKGDQWCWMISALGRTRAEKITGRKEKMGSVGEW